MSRKLVLSHIIIITILSAIIVAGPHEVVNHTTGRSSQELGVGFRGYLDPEEPTFLWVPYYDDFFIEILKTSRLFEAKVRV